MNLLNLFPEFTPERYSFKQPSDWSTWRCHCSLPVQYFGVGWVQCANKHHYVIAPPEPQPKLPKCIRYGTL